MEKSKTKSKTVIVDRISRVLHPTRHITGRFNSIECSPANNK